MGEDEEEKDNGGFNKSGRDTDFEEKLDDIFIKLLEKRFEGGTDTLTSVCKLRNIDANKDSNQLLRDLCEACKDTLRSLKKDPKTNYFILDIPSPYQTVATEVIEVCEFLTKINHNMPKIEKGKQSDDSKNASNSITELEEQAPPIKPLPLHRSFSSAPESQIEDQKVKKNLQHLRELVDTYQRWKEWNRENEKESENYYCQTDASPLKSVVQLIISKPSVKNLEIGLKNHLIRSSQRVIGV